MNDFENFFLNKKLLRASIAIAIICFAGSVITGCVPSSSGPSVMNMIEGICMVGLVFAIYWSYTTHNLAVLNTLIGASLGVFVFAYVAGALSNILLLGITNEYGLPANTLTTVVALIEAVLFVWIFFNHLSVNAQHAPASKRILVNQIIIFIMIIYQIISIVIYVLTVCLSSAPATPVIISNLFITVGKIFLFCIVICTETNLNFYKRTREQCEAEGTWTEEKKQETKIKAFGE